MLLWPLRCATAQPCAPLSCPCAWWMPGTCAPPLAQSHAAAPPRYGRGRRAGDPKAPSILHRLTNGLQPALREIHPECGMERVQPAVDVRKSLRVPRAQKSQILRIFSDLDEFSGSALGGVSGTRITPEDPPFRRSRKFPAPGNSKSKEFLVLEL